MGDLNSRIEGLKAQLSSIQSEVPAVHVLVCFFSYVHFQVESSKTKLIEAAEKNLQQKSSMEELELRLQDDRKVFVSQFLLYPKVNK